jgi:hypothetical protein
LTSSPTPESQSQSQTLGPHFPWKSDVNAL